MLNHKVEQERGYVIIANSEIEQKQAATLAYSIKSKMPDQSVAVIVPSISKANEFILEPVDYIIELPFKCNTAENIRLNDWQLFWSTPYKYTIALDCKMLIKEDHTILWDYLIDHHDMCFSIQQLDFMGRKINAKLKNIISNEYPHIKSLGSSMFFFNKESDLALRYFKLADVLMQNWTDTCRKFLKNQHFPIRYNPDIVHMLIAQHFDTELFPLHSNILSYVDMQATLENNILGRWERWTDRINVWSSANAKVKIQNFAITSNIYYHEDEFLTEDMINEHREYYRTITKKLA